jgi:hypothetical protein
MYQSQLFLTFSDLLTNPNRDLTNGVDSETKDENNHAANSGGSRLSDSLI